MPLLLRKTPELDWTGEGIPFRHQQSGGGHLESQQSACLPRSQVFPLFLGLFSDLFCCCCPPMPPSLSLPSTLSLSLFQAQWEEGASTWQLPESLNPSLLLTRREKRSCLQKRPPGAAEATAIRSGPSGRDVAGWQGSWGCTRRRADSQRLALSRVFRCYPGPEQLALEESQESSWVTRGGAAGELLPSSPWVSLSPSNSVPSECKRCLPVGRVGYNTAPNPVTGSSSLQLSKLPLPLDTSAEAGGNSLAPWPSSPPPRWMLWSPPQSLPTPTVSPPPGLINLSCPWVQLCTAPCKEVTPTQLPLANQGTHAL